MRALSIIPFILFYLYSSGQNNFTIHGKIEMLSKSQNIVFAGSGTFKAPIQKDGTFEISGKITEPGTALVFTDSSGADAIWLEPGSYNIRCKEITMEGIKGYLFRIPELEGPQDAGIYYGFSEPRFYIRGNSKEETLEKYRQFYSNYIDSIFKISPSTATLPEMLRSSSGYLGDEKVKVYMSLLDSNQKKMESVNQLDAYYRRKDKIDKEKYFEDFSMADDQGKIFKLSSITNKKLILIDFWSSDCAPCRRNHLRLAELYKKYSDAGLEIVSISLDDDKSEWAKAIQKDNMNWVNVSELKGWETNLAENYFIKSIPYSFWLDEKRKIIGTSLSDKEIEEYLK